MDIRNIQDNTIIICENNTKNKILRKLQSSNLFLNIKFFTKDNFLQEYFFSYDKKCIPFLMEKYNLKYDIIKMYLENLYFIENKIYQSSKLNFLVNLKNELINNNLIHYNKNFSNYIKRYNIIVIGYSYLNLLERKLFNDIDAKIVSDHGKYDIINVYEYNKMEDEINFVCQKICELIQKGININDIKLMNVKEEYYNDLERLFNLYHIPIKIETNNNLYSNNITKIFLNNIDKGLSYALDLIKNKDAKIVNKIVNICNNYLYIDNYDVLKKILINDFKNTSINNFNLHNYVEILSLNGIVFDNEYVFLMNFNTSSIPAFIKDEDYITDNIKDEISFEKTNDINCKIKEYTINKIKSIKNLTISYKLKDNKYTYYPSILVSYLNLNVIKNNNSFNVYAKEYDKLNLAKYIYNYETYGDKCDELFILKNNITIPYNTFNNHYHNISKDNLKEYVKSLTLSYSSLNSFNKCSFKYYLENILKIKKREDNIAALIGSILHEVLANSESNNDISEVIDNYLNKKEYNLNKKEEFFINLLKDDIKNVIDIIKEQQKDIKLDKKLFEKNISIDKSRDIPIEFVGFIDKILYKEFDDKTIVSLIDYKSGNQSIDIKYSKYGLNLQLPVYLYLIKKGRLFNNPLFAGFYLQFLLDKNIKTSEEYNELIADKLKLVGYSNNDPFILEFMDINYQNSNIIKGLKCKANGEFYKSSKVLSNNNIDELIELVDQNIDTAITNILNAEFNINPKKIGYKEDVSCPYCKYRDICFKKDKDYSILEEINESFGGNDAELD